MKRTAFLLAAMVFVYAALTAWYQLALVSVKATMLIVQTGDGVDHAGPSLFTLPHAIPQRLLLAVLGHLQYAPSLRLTKMPTPWGSLSLEIDRRPGATWLRVHCRHCRAAVDWIARAPLIDLDIEATCLAHGRHLDGKLRVGPVHADVAAIMTPGGIDAKFMARPVAVADLVKLFGGQIPETRVARIDGSLAANGELTWPDGTLSLAPQIVGLKVKGLGMDRLAYGRFTAVVVGADGKWERREFGEGAPGWLPLKQMGRYLPRAVLAAEDMRFYRHPGYDLTEMRGTLSDFSLSEGPARGASTLTQQLAKNLFVGGERTLARKLRELLYVAEMEQTLGKRRILELYLNIVEWGDGVHGARAAARRYFTKPAARLRPEQAAWLAAILHNPRRAWQTQYLAGAVDRTRADWVLQRMRGLTRKARAAAERRRIALTSPPRNNPPAVIAANLDNPGSPTP